MKDLEKRIEELLREDMYGENSHAKVVQGFKDLIQSESRKALERFSEWLDKDTKYGNRSSKDIFINKARQYFQDESVTACRLCNHDNGRLVGGHCKDCL